jgi:CheY-like chemotaxis protein
MSPQHPTQPPLDILVVEDNAYLRKLLCTVLDNTHMVHSAGSIKEGWQIYLEKDPAIVFLDINLPDGSGHELAQIIKRHNPSAYVIIATASDYAEDQNQARKNHVDGFIVKPFDKQAIRQYIDRYISAHSPA